ncbi:MAG TPA: hypothetical protein VEZ72_18020 [Paenibacillus sp.]|nr:hypothetical protein [Paenibacillus sp.]
MIIWFQDFDQNEWFILACLLIAYPIAFRLPRPFPKSFVVLIGLFSLSLAKGADHTLGVEPLDYYNTNEIPVFDATDFATWLLYPVAGYFFLYAYQRLRIQGLAIPVFVLGCSAAAPGFELICVRFRVFIYKDWEPGYSFLVYMLAQSATILFYALLRRWYRPGRAGR